MKSASKFYYSTKDHPVLHCSEHRVVWHSVFYTR